MSRTRNAQLYSVSVVSVQDLRGGVPWGQGLVKAQYKLNKLGAFATHLYNQY